MEHPNKLRLVTLLEPEHLQDHQASPVCAAKGLSMGGADEGAWLQACGLWTLSV